MITTQSARLMNLKDYGLPIGNPADVTLIDARTPDEAAFATIRRERADGLLLAGNPFAYVHRARLAAFAAEQRLPMAFDTREQVEEGGLLSYGVSVPGLFGHLAGYVDRILKAAQPAELPV